MEVANNFTQVPECVRHFAEERGMSVFHVNGQRLFGPKWEYAVSNWSPPRGSEVFVGKVPRDALETELVPHLEQAGPLFQLRLMMDFSGTNRGYCFAKYFSPWVANRAVALLDKVAFRNDWLAVTKSVENCKLVMAGVPQYKTQREIFEEVSAFSFGVVRIFTDWLPEEALPGAKGIVVVEYETHRAAALARSQMLKRKTRFWGYRVYLDWAEPEERIRLPWKSQMQVLCVTNLSRNTCSIALEKMFSHASRRGVLSIEWTRSKAFVTFRSRHQAELAKTALNGRVVDGNRIRVQWYNPGKLPFAKLAQRVKATALAGGRAALEQGTSSNEQQKRRSKTSKEKRRKVERSNQGSTMSSRFQIQTPETSAMSSHQSSMIDFQQHSQSLITYDQLRESFDQSTRVCPENLYEAFWSPCNCSDCQSANGQRM